MIPSLPLPVHHILLAAVTASAVALASLSPALGANLTGTIEKVEGEGRTIVIGGKSIVVSGSRSNVCIGGVCDQPRNKLKTGMECRVETAERNGKAEARKLSCK